MCWRPWWKHLTNSPTCLTRHCRILTFRRWTLNLGWRAICVKPSAWVLLIPLTRPSDLLRLVRAVKQSSCSIASWKRLAFPVQATQITSNRWTRQWKPFRWVLVSRWVTSSTIRRRALPSTERFLWILHTHIIVIIRRCQACSSVRAVLTRLIFPWLTDGPTPTTRLLPKLTTILLSTGAVVALKSIRRTVQHGSLFLWAYMISWHKAATPIRSRRSRRWHILLGNIMQVSLIWRRSSTAIVTPWPSVTRLGWIMSPASALSATAKVAIWRSSIRIQRTLFLKLLIH